MRTASIRTVQHNLAAILKCVEAGEEVRVTRRHAVVARIVPERDQTRVQHPDFVLRARQVWGKAPRGTTLSRTVIDGREDRV